MLCKPLIGLNADYRDGAKDASRYMFLANNYARTIEAAGGIPVIVPTLEDPQDLECVLDQVQGFVLIGGHDLDPRRDGFMLHPSVRCMDPRRETFDRQLMNRIASRRLPVYGVGVGMQLLNVTLGGNLFLHIPEDLPDAIPHKDPHDVGHRHGLDVVPGTVMERVFGDGEVRVNSWHHMAIDELAPGFRVSARCPDGVIEAIESAQEDWLAMGTQFHPEANSASALDLRIFEEFIDGVKETYRETRLVA